MGGFGVGGETSRTKNTYKNMETSPFTQTYMFNPQQMGGLQNSIYGAAMGQLGGIDWGNPGSWGSSGMFSGIGGGGVGASYDPATAGKFTEEFDPILKKLTEGPQVEKLLAQSLDPIGEQSQRSRQQILNRASAGGMLDSGGAIRAEIDNADHYDRLKGKARADAYLGTLNTAAGSTNNQVNAITQAESANAQASATASAAAAQANAMIQSAGIGARAGLMGDMMNLPLRYASLLQPTFTQGQQFQPVQTGSKSMGGSAKYGV